MGDDGRLGRVVGDDGGLRRDGGGLFVRRIERRKVGESGRRS